MTTHRFTQTFAKQLFPLCIAGMILLSGCGANPGSAPAPDPAPASASQAAAQQDAASDSANPDEGKERPMFDDHVMAYEQENSIESLAQADDPTRQGFFDSISTKGYTLAFAEEDQQTVSGQNQPLLEEYIAFLTEPASQHEGCGFDEAVEEYLESHPDIALNTEKGLIKLYEGVRFDYGLPPEDVESWGCSNEYAAGFIEYRTAPVEHTSGLTEEQLHEMHALSEEDWKRAEEEAARSAAEFDARSRRQLEEHQRRQQEREAQGEALTGY